MELIGWNRLNGIRITTNIYNDAAREDIRRVRFKMARTAMAVT